MSTFIKFPEITNHYQAKFIQKTLEQFPALKDEPYIVTEKLHGSNLQIYFEPGKVLYRVGSRRRFLDENSKFYNVWDALTRVGHVLSEGKYWVRHNQKSLRLFGELYGGNVQSGINYGPEQNVRFFAAMVDDHMISTAKLLCLDIPHLLTHLVPTLDRPETLESALAFDIDRPSELTPADHEGPNLIEGVVIQPYRKVYRLDSGRSFILKKKNPEFLVKKEKKARAPMESAIVELRVEFLDYITEARIDSIISQNGPFTELPQLGKYIVLTLNDAKKDFLRSHTSAAAGLDRKTLKYVFNVGGLIANMLKARL